MMDFKIGFGYDVHKLTQGQIIVLGGLKISHNKTAIAHSDGDVIIHAIMDALLGAAGLNDIGYYFPDTDPDIKNADSRELLKAVIVLIRKEGYEVGNVDVTLCAEAPKLSEYIEDIKYILAGLLQTSANSVSIKATTNEKLGFIGSEEGIACYAVALIKSIND
jgi:2-C-methyl-D-erythritol 2,4-cyclodiphosphate synthase